jgi:hypothetical protein
MDSVEDLYRQQQMILARQLEKHRRDLTPLQSPKKPRHSSECTVINEPEQIHLSTPKSVRMTLTFNENFGESAIKRRKREMVEKRKHWHHDSPLQEVCRLDVIDFWKSQDADQALIEWEYERQLDRMRWSSPESQDPPHKRGVYLDDSDEPEVRKRRTHAPRIKTMDSDTEVSDDYSRSLTRTSRSRHEPVAITNLPKSPNKPSAIMDEEMTNKMPKKRGRKPNIVKVVREVVVSPELASPGLASPDQVVKVWGQGVIDLRSDESVTKGKPLPTWKNQPALDLDESHDGYDMLTNEEIEVCRRLRLLPVQYLGIKDTLLTAAKNGQVFKKREAQKMCRVDVNKTAKVFDWFLSLNLLGPEFGAVDLATL